MNKLVRILVVAVGIVVLLIGLLVAYLTFVFDPNDYRHRLAEQVHKETGRELVIGGSIGLSVFPWIGVELQSVSLGNAEGFGDRPFASVELVEVRARLMPLLKSEIEVDRLVLNGLQLDLQRDEKGRTNWDDLIAAGADSEPAAGDKGPGPDDTARAIAAFAVSGVEIDSAEVTWEDRQAGVRQRVSNLSLKSGEIRPGVRFPLELGLDVESSAPAITGRLDWSGNVMLQPERSLVSIDDFSLSFAGQGAALPGGKLDVKVDAGIAADLAAGTFDVRDLVMRTFGIEARGTVKGTQLNETARITGEIEVPRFNPRDLLKAIGQATPEVSDSSALQQASLKSRFDASPTGVSLSGLEVRLDDSTLKGETGITDFDKQALRFDLALDAINVDRYLPPRAKDESAPAATPGAAAAGADPAVIRGLNMNGKFRIGQLVASGLTVSDVEINVRAADGVMRLAPLSANLYQGRYAGNVVLDGRGQSLAVSLDESLTGILVGPLLRDMTGAEERLTGSANLKAKLQARGNDADAMKRSLGGTAEFRFADGAVKGINVAQYLREAQARITGRPAPAVQEANQTDFTELTGTLQITNGLIRNNDLDARSPLLRVAGSGTADLGSEKIDYRIRASVVATLTGQGGQGLDSLKGVTVPIRVGGTFSSPSYALDVESLLTDTAKQQAREKIEEKLQERVPQDLQESIRRGLGGFLR